MPDGAFETTGADSEATVTQPAPAISGATVVTTIANAVAAHPHVAAEHAASIAASIIGTLYQAAPAIFAVSRASDRTQTEVSLGLGLFEALIGAFLRG